MLSCEENELLTRVAPGTPMGNTLRRYWIPALLAWELPAPDCPPVRVQAPGRELVAFRDTDGPTRAARRVLSRTAAPRCASAATRSAGCAVSTTAGSSTSPDSASTDERAGRAELRGQDPDHGVSRRSSWAASSGPTWGRRSSSPRCPPSSGPRCRRRTATCRRSSRSATGCRRWRAASTRRTRRSCTGCSTD